MESIPKKVIRYIESINCSFEKVLGGGSFGIVYLIFHKTKQTQYALKAIHIQQDPLQPKESQRLLNSAIDEVN